MKNPGSFLPEPPPPPKFELLSVIASLTMLTIGLGLVLYCFRDAGIIADELFMVAMVFIVAISAGVIFATATERQARRDAQKGPMRYHPPSIFILSGHWIRVLTL